MLNSLPLPAPALDDGWAEVRAGAHTVRYRRHGTGRAVVLLTPRAGSLALWPELVDTLRAEFRVIIPEPPVDVETEDWLGALLDGLGLQQVSAIAAGELCMAALERALLEPEQLSRIVFVGEGRGRTSALDGGFETDRGLATVPMLIVRRERTAEEVVPVIQQFLRGATGPSKA